MGSYLRKFPKPKFEHMCCELDSMSELSGFVYIKSHVKLHVKSKAQKVTPKTIWAPILPETPLCFEKGEGGGGERGESLKRV